MDMSIGSSNLNSSLTGMMNNSKTDSLESTLNNSNASDAELMKACKGFESYLMEQVYKSMEKTVDKSEEEENNDYMKQFGDMLYENYADLTSENQSTGIAQMLFDSMKRNS